MITALLSAPWKLATAGAVAVSIGLAGALFLEKRDHAVTEKARADLAAQIYTPGTGYLAQVAQLQTNVSTLDAKLSQQNDAIARQKSESDAAMAEAEKSLSSAQAATAAAERRIGVLMRPLVGQDVCQRMIEMDERFLETLK